jgi:hypothetical protein
VPPNHYQLPDDLVIKGAYHKNFHIEPHIPQEEIEKGASRFYQWHFDGALYDIPPPRVGCLLAVKTPKGPDCTVRWEDDEGTTMKIGPGATACEFTRTVIWSKLTITRLGGLTSTGMLAT